MSMRFLGGRGSRWELIKEKPRGRQREQAGRVYRRPCSFDIFERRGRRKENWVGSLNLQCRSKKVAAGWWGVLGPKLPAGGRPTRVPQTWAFTSTPPPQLLTENILGEGWHGCQGQWTQGIGSRAVSQLCVPQWEISIATTIFESITNVMFKKKIKIPILESIHLREKHVTYVFIEDN